MSIRNYRSNSILLIWFVLFLCPFSGWTQESVREELQPLVEEIQNILQQNENSASSDHAVSPAIICIGGCPGVGKSTIAKLLQKQLTDHNIVSIIVSLDHYGLSQKERKQFTSELDPRRIQWNKLHNNLSSIQKGETSITKPTIDQITKEMGEETFDLTHVDCILFEGCYALGDFFPMDFLQYADVAIYLETSLENIYDWKWQRELKKPVPRTSQAFFKHMMAILEDFAFHVYPTRKNADYIVVIDFFHHYAVTRNEKVKTNPTPDFNPLRIETLAY